jgi:hypothetical protein
LQTDAQKLSMHPLVADLARVRGISKNQVRSLPNALPKLSAGSGKGIEGGVNLAVVVNRLPSRTFWLATGSRFKS